MSLTLRRFIILVLIPAIFSSAVWSATALGAVFADRDTIAGAQSSVDSDGSASPDDTADHCTHACHGVSHFLGMVTIANTVDLPRPDMAPAWQARIHRSPPLKHQLPPPRV